MKNRKIHIGFTVFLLAIMLVGRVGIHIFHHHNPLSIAESSVSKNVGLASLIVSEQASDADCTLCKLDSFQALFIDAVLPFAFLLIFWKPIYQLLFSTLVYFSIFTKSRGPPFALSIA